jgi:site-specific DNA-cytosine methylase
MCGRKRDESKMSYVHSKLFQKSAWVCTSHLSASADILTVKNNHQKTLVELFSGSGHISKLAQARGYHTVTIDNNSKLSPDICIDIANLRRSELPHNIDIVWCSIPCTVYSILNLVNHWDKKRIGYRRYFYYPKTDRAASALNLLTRTIDIIKEMNPIYYFIENPRGALRHFPHLSFVPYRHTVSYNDYGFEVYKPTDIWTNNANFKPKPIKTAVGRTFSKGIEDLAGNYERSLIPPNLIHEVLDSFDFIQ